MVFAFSRMSYPLSVACNGIHQSYDETALKAWYFAWDKGEYQRHKERYYSLSMKSKAWINSKVLDQSAVVRPVISVIKFDPVGTHYPLLIG